jgi:hypothetical protein
LASCDTVVIGNDSPEFAELIAGVDSQPVVDLVGLSLSDSQREAMGERYLGIAW